MSDSQIASTRHGWPHYLMLQVRTVFDSSTAASARAGLPLEEQDSPEDDNNENAAEDGLASETLPSVLLRLQTCCKLRAYSAEGLTSDTDCKTPLLCCR